MGLPQVDGEIGPLRLVGSWAGDGVSKKKTLILNFMIKIA
jgi:hypothetical protein